MMHSWLTYSVSDALEIMEFGSAEEFLAWLGENHDGSAGVWVKLRKKVAGVVGFDYAQALDVALCYGWIDGQKGKFDDEFWVQRFTPRRAQSKWSKINRGKVEALVAEGRMRAPGQAEVDRAKADGRWAAAYAGAKSIEVPEDLTVALAGNVAAAEFFATLNSVNRYAILYRIGDAKKPETRAARIAKFVAMLAAGEKLHP
jgi:uncharacterized protein YdeI (YjbR/CyaY-like superfamily)